jgi:transcriptional regulator with XRE-family HTH domain
LSFCRVSLKAARPSKILQTWDDHIKKRRLELRLYQAQVAEMIGVDECTVTNWEKNRTTPMLWTLPNVIEFLGYDPSVGEPTSPGGKLLQFRKYRGMTQKELAKQKGTDQSTLGGLERKRGKQNTSTLQKVVGFLEAQHLLTFN